MVNLRMYREEFKELLLAGRSDDAISWARGLISEFQDPLDFLGEVFSPCMNEVGDLFGRLEIFLPELIEAADVAKAVTDTVINPALAKLESSPALERCRVLMASVQGDLHDIGKNIVGLMLTVNGFDVIDIGIDVPPRKVIEKAREVGADIVGLSSLMTTSMPYMKEVVELRDGFGLGEEFAVIVGGAPVTQEFSHEIGADAFGRDASDAVLKCTELMERRRQGIGEPL